MHSLYQDSRKKQRPLNKIPLINLNTLQPSRPDSYGLDYHWM